MHTVYFIQDYLFKMSFILQLNMLKLRKNNWSAEYFRFDEVFATSASQKRVYEVVAKPVVEVSISRAQSIVVLEYIHYLFATLFL